MIQSQSGSADEPAQEETAKDAKVRQRKTITAKTQRHEGSAKKSRENKPQSISVFSKLCVALASLCLRG
jgi:hypothetical protein